jgi:hypothetical protein
MFHGRPGPAWLAGVALAGASCLAVTACAGSASSSPSAAPAARTAAASPVDPLKALTGRQVETEAIANLKAASSVRVAGTVPISGTSVTVNLGIKHGSGCTGTIAAGSQGSVKLIVIGKVVYLDPDTQFWKAEAGTGASAASALVDGRYIKATTGKDGLSSLASMCDLPQLIASGKVSVSASKRAVTTLHGVRVLPLKVSDNGVLYVTDTSKPEIVEIYAPGSDAGMLTFSVGVPVTLTPPPASQVIDGSRVGL